ncbi:MAG: TonB-dependent receptor [Candidatus Synoicihabitans palmerolidicus]|nr:TonB-dependent receptor [Candidatus Synoicihabitans palmerolidicus]
MGDEAFLPPTTTDERSLFLFEEIEQSPTLWQFGARAGWQSIDVTDGTLREHDGDALSASLGWVRSFNEAWSLAASLARTERVPNAQELFADGPHIGTNAYEIGDTGLGTEVSRGIDLTLRRQSDWFSGALTLFANEFDGFIYESPTGAEQDELPVYHFVQRDASFHGAELETLWHLHEDEHGHLDLRVTGDFVRARNTTDHTDLPRTTPIRARIGLDWQRQNWRAGSELAHVWEQTRVAPAKRPPTATTCEALTWGIAGSNPPSHGICCYAARI